MEVHIAKVTFPQTKQASVKGSGYKHEHTVNHMRSQLEDMWF